MFVGVGNDHALYHRSSIGYWRSIPNSGSVTAITVLPDGTLLGVGLQGALYTRATLGSGWSPVPTAGILIPMAALAVLPDGRLVGVGRDRYLYVRDTNVGQWEPVDASRDMIGVGVMPDGTIVGVTPDNTLSKRGSLFSPWVPVADSGPVKAITVQLDGSLIGLRSNGSLATRATLDNSSWEDVPNSGRMVSVAALADGSLIGVDPDANLSWLPELPSQWEPVANSTWTKAISVLPDGTLLGVARDNTLITRASLDDPWRPVDNSDGVTAVTVLLNGTLLGVGTRGELLRRARLAGSWATVPGTGSSPVVAVTQLPDGTIVGVRPGPGHSLCTRRTLTSGWEDVPDSGDVKGITALADGTLLGVGLDGSLWTRTTLTSDWVLVPPQSSTVRVIGAAVAPDEGLPPPAAAAWFLQFTSRDPLASDGDGRPWGDGTAMAARASDAELPWDNGCLVTPFVGGFPALNAIRDVLEAAIDDAALQASQGVPPGRRGHVYIADWLLNGLRDLSEANPWRGRPWNPAMTVAKDQTALGLLVRLMSAGITVRVLLWLPSTWQSTFMQAIVNEHWSIAAAIQDHNAKLQEMWDPPQPLGIVGLDLRTGAQWSASLHQKMVVVRVGRVNAGFCGGVDLAFTRRDFRRATDQVTGSGDWQSGDTTPLASKGWPRQSPPPAGGYPAFPDLGGGDRFPEDLPANVYGDGYRYWHDHHLKLEGPIVTSLEQQFAERWIIDPDRLVHMFRRKDPIIGGSNQVKFTSRRAFDSSDKRVLPLPEAVPCPPVGGAAVQMWRTIPLRYSRPRSPFMRGEFTVMAGVANAIAQAQSLITIWDQYFWSVPVAKLLAARLTACPSLRLIIVLPPFGTTDPANELKLRKEAMQVLWQGLSGPARSRVLALNLWKPPFSGRGGVGIYVHAKVQTYDDALLVCGSANMNRRSLECDAELDCAVLHRPTLQRHLANLFACVTGSPWTDFGGNWLGRYWEAVRFHRGTTLISDPFFTGSVLRPTTPNGVPIPYDGRKPYWLFEPTSIADNDGVEVDDGNCPECPGNPDAPGRLDQVTFLLERCNPDGTWPWRVPFRRLQPGEAGAGGEAAEMPRLTL